MSPTLSPRFHFLSTDWTHDSFYLEINFFFSRCCRCINLFPVLSAPSAQQDTSVSCAQFLCLLPAKIGTHFFAVCHQKNNKTRVTRNSVMIENLRRISQTGCQAGIEPAGSDRCGNSAASQTFLIFAAKPVFDRSNFDSYFQPLWQGNSFTCVTHESAHVLLLSHGCGQIMAAPGWGCTCVSCSIWFEMKIFFPCLSSLSSLWLSLSGWSEAGFGGVGGQI